MKLYKFIDDNIYNCFNVICSSVHKNKIKLFLDANVSELIIPNGKHTVEIGPRTRSLAPWSSNVMSIAKKSGISIKSIIKSIIYVTDETAISIFSKNHDKMTEQIYNGNNTISYFKRINLKKTKENPKLEEYLSEINDYYGLSLTIYDIDYIKKNYYSWKDPLFAIFDISQSNSEHCRHHFFRGNLIINNLSISESLFDLVKKPLEKNKNNSLVAFCDNSSVIKGYSSNILVRNYNNSYKMKETNLDFLLTAETHNFPTGISPFSGAATGIGGRIRDVQATGKGGLCVCGSAGYCVGDIYGDEANYPKNMANPLEILIDASNGASDYGNKFGEPIILGFTYSFKSNTEPRIEWIKPIMFTSGLGMIQNEHVIKNKPLNSMSICKIGGPVYKIGLGGSSASSRISSNELDYISVQRDDAEMEQKMDKVIRTCIELGEKNPIESIHDQGAGGNGNVLKEIIEDKGAIIDIGKLKMGEKGLDDIEIWLSEYQESNAILVKDKNIRLVQDICEREYVNLDIVGKIKDNGLIIKNNEKSILDNYEFQKNIPKRNYHLEKTINHHKSHYHKYQIDHHKYQIDYESNQDDLERNICYNLEKVLKNIAVGSKRFLTNKVDRSVTGLIAQQQCVGPLHTPLSNFGLISQSHFKDKSGYFRGCATSIGCQPLAGLSSPKSLSHKSVAEMLTNLMWVVIEDFGNIKCSANWMWPSPNTDPKEGYKMYMAVKELSDLLIDLGIAIDGGKDSLSMAVKFKNEMVKSPGTLVLTSYVDCPNIYEKVTPDIKSNNSILLFVDLSEKHLAMGGSILEHVYDFHDESPLIRDIDKLKTTFIIVQNLIKNKLIISGHDKSDGGLIVTLLEMAFSGNKGLEMAIPNSKKNDIDYINRFLFNEEIGVVLECLDKNQDKIIEMFQSRDIKTFQIAKTVGNNKISIKYRNQIIYENSMTKLRWFWESSSYNLEKKQCELKCVEKEKLVYQNYNIPYYFVPFRQNWVIPKRKFTVGILREEGTNSEKELASAFYHAGFNVVDINTFDLLNDRITLDKLNGIGFAGGFSFSDVLGSGKGWYNVIRFNDKIKKQFDNFYERKDTFSIGICNGCQLMSYLGWVEGNLVDNNSGRFESRFSTLKVTCSKNIFLKNMDNLVFGMWVAHGEGKFIKPKNTCLQYVDFNNNPTEEYPYNPNGSHEGTAAVGSNNNRHLAIMPHPERSFLKWQIPWSDVKINTDFSPWFKMFLNVRNWLEHGF